MHFVAIGSRGFSSSNVLILTLFLKFIITNFSTLINVSLLRLSLSQAFNGPVISLTYNLQKYFLALFSLLHETRRLLGAEWEKCSSPRWDKFLAKIFFFLPLESRPWLWRMFYVYFIMIINLLSLPEVLHYDNEVGFLEVNPRKFRKPLRLQPPGDTHFHVNWDSAFPYFSKYHLNIPLSLWLHWLLFQSSKITRESLDLPVSPNIEVIFC